MEKKNKMSKHTALKAFSELTLKLNKLNKLFMDRIEADLKFNNIYEINAVQALMLKNIGIGKTTVTQATTKGYYLGTNISYNITSLNNKGYLTKQTYYGDARCIYLVLTKKGHQVLKIINKTLLTQQESLTKDGLEDNAIENINSIIDKLQRVLDNSIRI